MVGRRPARDRPRRLHPHRRGAVVLFARQPLEALAAHFEGHAALEDVRAMNAASRDVGEQLAADGADHAKRAGLNAHARVAGATDAIADTIVRVADGSTPA